MTDAIKAPAHYTGGDIEPKDLILAGCFPHYVASAIEYIWRHKKKNGAEDLRKAAQCLRMHIAAMEEDKNYNTHVRVCKAFDRSTVEQWGAFERASGFRIGRIAYRDYTRRVIATLDRAANAYDMQQGENHA